MEDFAWKDDLAPSQHAAKSYLHKQLEDNGLDPKIVYDIMHRVSMEGVFLRVVSLKNGEIHMDGSFDRDGQDPVAEINDMLKSEKIIPNKDLGYGVRRKFSYTKDDTRAVVDFAPSEWFRGINPVKPLPVDYLIAFTFFKEVLQKGRMRKKYVYDFINTLGEYCVTEGVTVRKVENSGRNIVHLTAEPSQDIGPLDIGNLLCEHIGEDLTESSFNTLLSDLPIIDLTLPDKTRMSVYIPS